MNWQEEIKIKKETIKKELDDLKLRIESKFIPFSQSRNKDNKYKSLNFEVTLFCNDKPVLTELYSMGSAYCLSKDKDKYNQEVMRDRECESGYTQVYFMSHQIDSKKESERAKPELIDFMSSIILDSYAIENSFDDWCSSLGFNSDSIKDKTIYDNCIQNAIKLNCWLGFHKVMELKELYTDY